MDDVQNVSPPETLAQEDPATGEVLENQNTEQEEGQETPEYVTKKDLEQFGSELARRLKQSARDRDRAIEQQLQAMKKRIESAGVQLGPEQEAKLRQSIADELEGGEGDEADPETNAGDDDVHPVFKMTANIFAQEGVEITAQDPEFKDVDAALNDPNGSMEKYLSVLYTAIGAKKSRLANQQESASARTASGGASDKKGQFVAKNAADYWSRAYKK